MNDTNHKPTELTPEGFEELKAELEDLINDKLPKAIKRVADAREFGDLSENSEYHDARDDRNLVDSRIAEIEKILEKATIIKATRSKDKVGMGSIVTIHLKAKKSQTRSLQIVGEYEADPLDGKISSVSPLGKALMGKKKGDEVIYQAPAGEIIYKITEIK